MITLVKKIINLKRIYKQLLVYLFDVNLFLLSLFIAIAIRYDLYDLKLFFNIESIILGLIIFTLSFLIFGLYRTIFRFSNINIVKIIFFSIILYFICFFLINYYYLGIPKSLIVIQSIVFFIFISIFRLYIPNFIFLINIKKIIPFAIIYGAGDNGSNILNNLKNYNIRYFIDDDESVVGKNISNKKIYSFNKIFSYEKDKITHVFISFKIKNFDHKKLILKKFHNYNIVVRFMPEFDKSHEPFLFSDKLIDINFDDLIKHNKFYEVNYSSIDFEDSIVLVTGGGGSIGSELCKQLIELKINSLVIADNSEYNLYNIDKTLNKNNHKIKIFSYLISIDDYSSLENLYKKYKFNYVFHAAAYKHVPLIENNILASIKNNIFGSYNVAYLSIKYKVNNLTLISTDKAVNPTNVMGATKRISEKIFYTLARLTNDTNITIVRFGNVINSNGSVVPLFNNQIRNREPVTVTHPEVTRYLMTIPDAVKLILETSIISKANKSGLIYLLDMGKPIKILELAKKMISLYGLTEGSNTQPGQIEIKFIGLRPGEKLHEELYLSNEIYKTKNEKIFLVDENKEKFEQLDEKLNTLQTIIDENDISSAIKFLEDNVEGYSRSNLKFPKH